MPVHRRDLRQVLQQVGRHVGRLGRVGAGADRIDQAAEALGDRLGDLVVAADGGEQVHDVVGHFLGHLVPLAGAGHGVELAAEVAQPMHLEHRPVGRRRAVEGHAIAHPVEQLGDRLVVLAGDHEAAARDLEALAAATARGQPGIEDRHDVLLEVLPGAERVELHVVRFLGGDLQHDRTDGGDAQPRQRAVIGLGHEVGRHQGEAIVLALVVELAVALPRRPDRPHRLHVLADARRRRRPRHGEAPLVVGAHLAADAERHARAAEARGEVPADIGHRHGRAGEGDGDAGVQLDALGGGAGDGQRQERLVPVLLGADAGVARRLDRLGSLADRGQVLLRQRREYAHHLALPDLSQRNQHDRTVGGVAARFRARARVGRTTVADAARLIQAEVVVPPHSPPRARVRVGRDNQVGDEPVRC